MTICNLEKKISGLNLFCFLKIYKRRDNEKIYGTVLDKLEIELKMNEKKVFVKKMIILGGGVLTHNFKRFSYKPIILTRFSTVRISVCFAFKTP